MSLLYVRLLVVCCVVCCCRLLCMHSLCCYRLTLSSTVVVCRCRLPTLSLSSAVVVCRHCRCHLPLSSAVVACRCCLHCRLRCRLMLSCDVVVCRHRLPLSTTVVVCRCQTAAVVCCCYLSLSSAVVAYRLPLFSDHCRLPYTLSPFVTCIFVDWRCRLMLFVCRCIPGLRTTTAVVVQSRSRPGSSIINLLTTWLQTCCRYVEPTTCSTVSGKRFC